MNISITIWFPGLVLIVVAFLVWKIARDNPIVRRELIGLLRTKRAMLLQVLLAAALSLLVVLRWPTDSLVDISGRQAQEVFRLFGYGLMVALILLAPVFPATSVVRERREGTLALLLNSPMSPFSIFIGKMLGVLGFVLLLLLLSVPAAAACYAMGGVDRSQVISAYIILFLLAVQYASLGLLISSYAATSDSALRLTYGAILVMAVVTLGPKQFLQGLLAPPLSDVVEWIRAVSPIPAMMETLRQSAVGSQGLESSPDVVNRYIKLSLISIVIFSVWTASRFSQRMFDRARAAGKVTDERSAGVQRYRRVMFLWFFDPQRRTGLIGPLTNPVMVKEFRTRRFGRSYWLMRIMGACLILSLGLMLATTRGTIDWGVTTLASIMVVLSFALVILLTPTLASGLISGERESGGWQLLQMTPLSSFTIVSGKLFSVGVTLLLILLATLPGYAVVVLIQNSELPQVIRVLITLLLTAAFAVLMSAAVSSLFRRTGPATATAYTIMVGLCAGTLLFWLGEGAPFSRSTVETVLKANPLAAALRLIKASGFADYELVPANWWFMGIACAVCLVVLLVQTMRLNRPQ